MKLLEEERKRVLNEFEALAKCRHNLLATSCGHCKAKTWQDTLTITGKTIGQLIDTFVELGKIDRIELEQHIDKKINKKHIKRTATIAGVTILGGLVLYEGGKIIARLFGRKENKDEKEVKKR